MQVHRLTRLCLIMLFVPTFISFTALSSRGQECDTPFVKRLVAELTDQDTTTAITAAYRRYPDRRIYLFMIKTTVTNVKPSMDSVRMFLPSRKIPISGLLPCLLELSTSRDTIVSLSVKRSNANKWQDYSVVVDKNVQPGLRIVNLPLRNEWTRFALDPEVYYMPMHPPPPTRQPCPDTIRVVDTLKVHCYRGFDRRFFTLPLIKKDISYLTFSTLLVSAGTYYVFRRERFDAEDNFEKYKNAKTLEEVSRARIETEKTRTHRNVARGVFFSATGAFAALLVRDLFFRKPEGSRDPLCHNFENESRFACVPNITHKELSIDFRFNF